MIDKSQIINVQPEQQPVSDMQPIVTTSSPAIGNTPVVGSTVYLMDCVAGMKEYPDKWFDLAVVDPEYGISVDEWMAKDSNTQRGKSATKRGEYKAKGWDKQPPCIEYFYELFRVSKNQIVWGANHFISRMPYDSSCWIVWDKENGDNGYADCELAWTSFDKAVRKVKHRWHGMLQKDMKNKETRIHPTQKPVGLYDWIYGKFAEKDFKVLDTHLGSGSSRISADKAGLDFTGFEIAKDYFNAGEKRYQNYKSQLRIEGW